LDSSHKLDESHNECKREKKFALKFNPEQIPKEPTRKLSLDFDHREKLKSQDLKNMLQTRLNGYLSK